MLARNEILTTLSHLKMQLAPLGVSQIGLYGSSVRDQAGAKSDIDILIDFRPDQETFRNFMGACELIEAGLPGRQVDIVTRGGLSPYIGPHILNEVEYV